MKTSWATKSLIVGLALSVAISTAWAGPVNANLGGARHGKSGHGTPILDGLRGAARHASKSDHPIIDGLRHEARHNGYHGDHPVLDAARDRYRGGGYDRGYGYGGGYGYYDGGRHHDDYARAYRDVGIANAIVDLAGVAVSASRPVYYPAPVVVVEPVHRGYYTTQSVLVSPAHYVDERVYVPVSHDSCGRVFGGYYEVRQRLIPDAYESRQVWVEE